LIYILVSMSMTRLVVALLGAAALSFMIVSMLMIVSDSSIQSRNLLDGDSGDDLSWGNGDDGDHSGNGDHGDHRHGDRHQDDDDDDTDPPGDKQHDDDYTAIDVTSSSVDDDDDARIETDCGFLKSHWVLRKALAKVVCGRHDRPDCGTQGFPGASQSNGGFGTNMWASIVNRAGRVCAVAYSGEDFDNQWLGSRVISVQKAYAANAFSLDDYAISTANLFGPTQNGKPLAGLVDANPVDPHEAYLGYIGDWGDSCTDDDDDDGSDPFCGKRIGGVNTFGGGLALYDKHGDKKGAIGVSGDTACADHVIAWKLRHELDLDYVPAGPTANSGNGTDQIEPLEHCGLPAINGNPFCHPYCAVNDNGDTRAAYDAIVLALPDVRQRYYH